MIGSFENTPCCAALVLLSGARIRSVPVLRPSAVRRLVRRPGLPVPDPVHAARMTGFADDACIVVAAGQHERHIGLHHQVALVDRAPWRAMIECSRRSSTVGGSMSAPPGGPCAGRLDAQAENNPWTMQWVRPMLKKSGRTIQRVIARAEDDAHPVLKSLRPRSRHVVQNHPRPC